MTGLNNSMDSFIRFDDGAVTVDLVVLTAAMTGIGMAVLTVVSGGVGDLSGDISVELASMEVGVDAGTGAPFARNLWDARTGGVAGLESWITGFEDQQLLTHMTNQAQYANTAQTGHPYDTYHDEFWVARDEAISRGLIEEDTEIEGMS